MDAQELVETVGPIIRAIRARAFARAEALIVAAGAVATSRYDEEESYLLHEAVLASHSGLCRLLLGLGADVNAKNTHYDTALHYAAYHASAEVCSVLLDAGADPHAVGFEGRTPLHHVAESGPLDKLAVLVAAGGDVGLVSEGANKTYLTPFQSAIERSFGASVSVTIPYMVLELGQSLEQRTGEGKSLADIAASQSIRDLLKSLEAELTVRSAISANGDAGSVSRCGPPLAL
jgi:ankyrin repeat protein